MPSGLAEMVKGEIGYKYDDYKSNNYIYHYYKSNYSKYNNYKNNDITIRFLISAALPLLYIPLSLPSP